jgi:hypothetical protein
MNRLPSLSNCSILIALMLALTIGASAQQAGTRFTTDGTTAPAIAPGAPAGSFALSGFESVNNHNGNLNFALPLLKIGGRGKAGYTLMLKIEHKWRVEHVVHPNNCGPNGCSSYDKYWFQNPSWWEGISPGYGPGVLQGRVAGISRACPETGTQGYAKTRLTFTGGDGTEYEFVDQLSNGQPAFMGSGCFDGNNRGRVWVTNNGENATFISDTDIFENLQTHLIYPSGYMILKDGTRYRIDVGLVSWIRDTNGNEVTFIYSGTRVTSITDSLNRVVTISYGASFSDPDTITYKGANGASRTIIIGHTNLGSALRSGFSVQTYHQLFPGLNNTQLTTPYDPNDKFSYVKLPNNGQYNFFYNSRYSLRDL